MSSVDVSTWTERDAEHKKSAYFDLGVQYYLAGRWAAFAQLNPVFGNLFHHAIEMFIKGSLARLDTAALKRLGHQLVNIWAASKNTVSDPTLDRFDSTIAELNRYEYIRYPERVLAEGMQSFIGLIHGTEGTSSMTSPPIYQLVVEDIDTLVRVIFDKASVNPAFFTDRFSDTSSARACLERVPRSPLLPVDVRCSST
jgi:hypothetical protein